MRLIKNGQVLIDNCVEKTDILIDEGKIIQIDKTEKHRIQQIENQSQKRIGKRSSVDYDSQKGDVIIWKT